MLVAATQAADKGMSVKPFLIVVVVVWLIIAWAMWIARGYGNGRGSAPWK